MQFAHEVAQTHARSVGAPHRSKTGLDHPTRRGSCREARRAPDHAQVWNTRALKTGVRRAGDFHPCAQMRAAEGGATLARWPISLRAEIWSNSAVRPWPVDTIAVHVDGEYAQTFYGMGDAPM